VTTAGGAGFIAGRKRGRGGRSGRVATCWFDVAIRFQARDRKSRDAPRLLGMAVGEADWSTHVITARCYERDALDFAAALDLSISVAVQFGFLVLEKCLDRAG
jgi:hypothetical protein